MNPAYARFIKYMTSEHDIMSNEELEALDAYINSLHSAGDKLVQSLCDISNAVPKPDGKIWSRTPLHDALADALEPIHTWTKLVK